MMISSASDAVDGCGVINNNSLLLQLPNELLVHILELIPFKDVFRVVSRVNKHLRLVVDEHFVRIRVSDDVTYPSFAFLNYCNSLYFRSEGQVRTLLMKVAIYNAAGGGRDKGVGQANSFNQAIWNVILRETGKHHGLEPHPPTTKRQWSRLKQRWEEEYSEKKCELLNFLARLPVSASIISVMTSLMAWLFSSFHIKIR